MSWEELTEKERDDCMKYLKLLKVFVRDNQSVSLENKKWMLQNCDLPTHLVPEERMDRFWL